MDDAAGVVFHDTRGPTSEVVDLKLEVGDPKSEVG